MSKDDAINHKAALLRPKYTEICKFLVITIQLNVTINTKT